MDLEAKRAWVKELGRIITAALEGPGDVATRLAASRAVRAKCEQVVELSEGPGWVDPIEFPVFVEVALLIAEAHARTGKPEEALAWFARSDEAME